MSNAKKKTDSLKRVNLPVDLLDANPLNPNVMDDAEFNLLYDNIERMGVTDPVLVRPMLDGRYRIVGGHHRCEVAKLVGLEEVPCTVITDPTFDDDAEKFQMVRHNVIHGRVSPDKFLKLYESLSEKHSATIMAEAFGFGDEEEFAKLIKSVQKTLPHEMQEQFAQAATEIKTIDGLSKLLNQLFGKFGDTLPYGYMLLDFGGQDSIWLRMDKETKQDVLSLGDVCKQVDRSMDSVLGGLIRAAAEGQLDEVLKKIVASTPEIDIPVDFAGIPTEEYLSGGTEH